MKYIAFLFILIPTLVFAADPSRITLTNPKAMSSPTAVGITIPSIEIFLKEKTLKVRYYFVDSNEKPLLEANGRPDHIWLCSDVENLDTLNSQCLANGNPNACCTGPLTGTCNTDMLSTCFSDVFKFNIRAQDVGNSLGAGLKTLIWNKMKVAPEINEGGSFDE